MIDSNNLPEIEFSHLSHWYQQTKHYLCRTNSNILKISVDISCKWNYHWQARLVIHFHCNQIHPSIHPISLSFPLSLPLSLYLYLYIYLSISSTLSPSSPLSSLFLYIYIYIYICICGGGLGWHLGFWRKSTWAVGSHLKFISRVVCFRQCNQMMIALQCSLLWLPLSYNMLFTWHTTIRYHQPGTCANHFLSQLTLQAVLLWILGGGKQFKTGIVQLNKHQY